MVDWDFQMTNFLGNFSLQSIIFFEILNLVLLAYLTTRQSAKKTSMMSLCLQGLIKERCHGCTRRTLSLSHLLELHNGDVDLDVDRQQALLHAHRQCSHRGRASEVGRKRVWGEDSCS